MWREASGVGTIYSFTETYVPIAGFEERTPYLLAMVELEEGVGVESAQVRGVDAQAQDPVLVIRQHTAHDPGRRRGGPASV